jgi:cytoskeletal protein CcmA (bactofilin family)
MPAAKDKTVNTIIGPDTDVTGDINASGYTRVDGSMRGNLSAGGRVIIGEKARMKSDVYGTFVTVGGVVAGNVIASERLVVLSSGLVMGDVLTRRIQADDGCLIHGKITVASSDEAFDAALKNFPPPPPKPN